MTPLFTRIELPLLVIALSTTGLLLAVLIRFREIQHIASENQERVHYMSLAGNSVFWKFDFSTNTIEWGEGFEKLYARSRSGMERTTLFWESLLHPDDKARVIASLEALEKSDDTWWSQEYRILTLSSVKHVLDRGIIIRDEKGVATKLLGAISDVSDQVAAREAAREGAKRFRDVVENLADVFYNHSPHKQKMYYVNAMYEVIWGKTTQSLYENPRSFMDSVHPDDAHVLYESFTRQLAGERTEVEYRIVRPDGKVRWIRDQAVPIAGTDGPATQIVGTARDITDSKLATLALIESEKRLKTIGTELQINHQRMVEAQEVAKLGSWEADIITGGIDWSPETYRIFGQDPETFKPSLEAIRALLPARERNTLSAEFERMLAVEGSHFLEHRLIDEKGGVRNVELRFRSVLGEDGRPLRVVGTVLDVTERKSHESRLHEMQKMEAVGLLAGGIAHDFNNMLTVIIAQSQMALAGRVSAEKLPITLGLIHDAANRSAELTRQLLAFAQRREESGTPLNPVATLTEVMPILRSLAGENIRFEPKVSDGAWNVRMGSVAMHQVLTNLVLNARDAIRSKKSMRGGLIRIVVENVPAGTNDPSNDMYGDCVRITVADDGIGMDESIRERVFEPFFTTKEVGSGTGLGLSVLHGIITQAGGRIRISSRAGYGTEVTIHLPRYEGDIEATTPDAPPLGSRAGALRVLVVEDEPMVLETTTGMLHQLGCIVTSTLCPLDALSKTTQGHDDWDLLLTDLVMPQMNGYELAEKVRERRPDIGILLMTGYDPGLAQDYPRRNLVDDLIQKPFTLDALSRAISHVCPTRA